MFILAWIRKAYRILSSDASPSAIAFAVAFGLTAGFVPLNCGAGLLLVLAVLIFRVQLSTAIAFWVVGGLIRLAGAVSLFDSIGEALHDPGSGFWNWFLDLPGVELLDLRIPAVLGGLVAGVVLGAILFVPVRLLVISYRRWVHEKVSENKFFRWLTNFFVVKLLRFIFIGVR